MFADDVILLSSSRDVVARMLVETRDALRTVGLDVGMEKTHWTSWPSEKGESICIDEVSVMWAPHLVFVAGVLDFRGNSGSAIGHRAVQAKKTHHM